MNTISQIRARLGVTQATMADALGVTQGNVSNYERGQTVPPETARLLIAYAETLGLNITFNDVYASSLNEEAPARRSTDSGTESVPCSTTNQLTPQPGLIECASSGSTATGNPMPPAVSQVRRLANQGTT